MAKCGYACVGCGQCRGILKPPILIRRCLQCGFENPRGSQTCQSCGASLSIQAGVTNTAGKKLQSMGTNQR